MEVPQERFKVPNECFFITVTFLCTVDNNIYCKIFSVVQRVPTEYRAIRKIFYYFITKNVLVSDLFLCIHPIIYLHTKFELFWSSGTGLEFWSISQSVLNRTIFER